MRRRLTARTLAAALAVAASQGLLAAAFASVGRRDGMAAAAVSALGWAAVLALALPAASLCLAASLALGVLAAMAGAPGWLGAAAAGAAIAAWDLTLLATGETRAVDGEGERRILASRLRALAAGILPGLALAALLGRVRLELPFVLLAVVALLALVALERAARRWG